MCGKDTCSGKELDISKAPTLTFKVPKPIVEPKTRLLEEKKDTHAELKFKGNEYMTKDGDIIHWAIDSAHENSSVFKTECDSKDDVAIGILFFAKY